MSPPPSARHLVSNRQALASESVKARPYEQNAASGRLHGDCARARSRERTPQRGRARARRARGRAGRSARRVRLGGISADFTRPHHLGRRKLADAHRSLFRNEIVVLGRRSTAPRKLRFMNRGYATRRLRRNLVGDLGLVGAADRAPSSPALRKLVGAHTRTHNRVRHVAQSRCVAPQPAGSPRPLPCIAKGTTSSAEKKSRGSSLSGGEAARRGPAAVEQAHHVVLAHPHGGRRDGSITSGTRAATLSRLREPQPHVRGRASHLTLIATSAISVRLFRQLPLVKRQTPRARAPCRSPGRPAFFAAARHAPPRNT